MDHVFNIYLSPLPHRTSYSLAKFYYKIKVTILSYVTPQSFRLIQLLLTVSLRIIFKSGFENTTWKDKGGGKQQAITL